MIQRPSTGVIVPTPTWGTFVQWDANQPGPALVNLARVNYIGQTGDGRAVLVFDHERLLLNVPYADVAAIVGGVIA